MYFKSRAHSFTWTLHSMLCTRISWEANDNRRKKWKTNTKKMTMMMMMKIKKKKTTTENNESCVNKDTEHIKRLSSYRTFTSYMFDVLTKKTQQHKFQRLIHSRSSSVDEEWVVYHVPCHTMPLPLPFTMIPWMHNAARGIRLWILSKIVVETSSYA